ncbi:hypothetical protein [Haliea sp.]|jgi:hypothetical protein|uniref:hypothetical protein n=1 Tax=Haliea sp. TaxID=1932666 RepID=UPI00257A164D|nr:hypothetical protein [Haliea sp.]|tara:strand:+ start:1039 stop:1281 length:243 start_codon:yes stop_codon:yes gene_type:complete
MNQPQQQGPNIDFKNTTALNTPSGGKIWQQGVILRKVSKFVTGTSDDAILPIPVFYDPETNEILKEGVPKELVDVIFNEE